LDAEGGAGASVPEGKHHSQSGTTQQEGEIMIQNRRFRGQAGCWIVLAVAGMYVPCMAQSVPAKAARSRDWARQVYTATGVQGGFVVHLGCRNGRQTAALGADEKYTVQGLEPDAAKVQEARMVALFARRGQQRRGSRHDGRPAAIDPVDRPAAVVAQP
jgi:hypothetical protein